jgi:hypothetical protein
VASIEVAARRGREASIRSSPGDAQAIRAPARIEDIEERLAHALLLDASAVRVVVGLALSAAVEGGLGSSVRGKAAVDVVRFGLGCDVRPRPQQRLW